MVVDVVYFYAFVLDAFAFAFLTTGSLGFVELAEIDHAHQFRAFQFFVISLDEIGFFWSGSRGFGFGRGRLGLGSFNNRFLLFRFRLGLGAFGLSLLSAFGGLFCFGPFVAFAAFLFVRTHLGVDRVEVYLVDDAQVAHLLRDKS